MYTLRNEMGVLINLGGSFLMYFIISNTSKIYLLMRQFLNVFYVWNWILETRVEQSLV